MNRRTFLKLFGTSAVTVATKSLSAAEEERSPKQFVGVLTDTTRCIGCRSCEKACGEANNLLVPDVEKDDALEKRREPSEKQRTVVNKFKTDKGFVYVKKQCMHCWQPACSAACLTNAMYKTKEGPIIWKPDQCMGCRYCMVACPFSSPKYEYHSWNPRVIKCDMCWNRLSKGEKPACVEACPTDTLTFGLKKDLMEIARTRLYKHPDSYVHHIYGEHEVGGTGWLYLASVPFEQLGFRTDLGTIPYPEYTKEFLYAVPGVILIIPPLLYGLRQLTKKDDNDKDM